ncbi:Lectin BRA-3 [Exaiptasia diaphana]|nr:Lectin BRA-3 [Exaiptasia diaphana]
MEHFARMSNTSRVTVLCLLLSCRPTIHKDRMQTKQSAMEFQRGSRISCVRQGTLHQSIRTNDNQLLGIGRSQRENVFVQQQLNGAKGWFGFNDRSVEGDFRWSSKLRGNWTYWEVNQPDNAGNQDCVRTLGVHHDYRWDDASCADCHNFTCAKGGLENSAILHDYGSNQYWQDLSGFLSPVLQDASKSRWVRCWRAASDGWDVDSTFHPQCDNKGPTVTIVRVGSYIFGGYTDVSWDSYSDFAYSTKAFLFSLYNTRGYSPVKLPSVQDHQYAIYRNSGYGPTFGNRDMYISNQASSNAYSYHAVSTYKAPPGCSYDKYCSFYTGNIHFTPSDVEVFYETTN